MKTPSAGLRRLLYNSMQPAKVAVSVAPGDELVVSEDLASQLQAADSHFEDYDADKAAAFPVNSEPAPSAPSTPFASDAPVEDDEEPEDESPAPAAAVKKATKRTAKKA